MKPVWIAAQEKLDAKVIENMFLEKQLSLTVGKMLIRFCR